MRKIKTGFTLAEVLITLGVIGVIAAIVMPTVMVNYTYKTVGVKLSKFAAQLEGSTRPFVVQNTNFYEALDVTNYLTEAMLIKNLDDFTTTKVDCTSDAHKSQAYCVGQTSNSSVDVPVEMVASAYPAQLTKANAYDFKNLTSAVNKPIILKDGTSLLAYMDTGYDEEKIPDLNVSQVGEVVFGVAFAPNVNGLPKAVFKSYRFVVTELGYVYPDRQNDKCLSAIYDNDFVTTSKTFAITSDVTACTNLTTSGS